MTALQPRTERRQTAILGVGAYRPERVVDNHEICQVLDSSDEWIRERTGIVERRWARPDETIIDMAEAAARDAIAMAGVDPVTIGAVIVATVSHTSAITAAAPLVAHRLGLDAPAAFDLTAGCAGYCHAVATASDLVATGTCENVLVVGVEKLTDYLDPTDRGTAFIFSDGAGASVVGVSDAPRIGPTVWGSDGSKWDVIGQTTPWNELRTSLADAPAWPTITMQGQSVFRWAVWGVAPVCRRALEAAGLTVDDIDVFIPHQANDRITTELVKQLRLPERVVVAHDIVDSGNSSAASIPTATARMLADGRARSGDVALQVGFGAGLSYAAQVVVLP